MRGQCINIAHLVKMLGMYILGRIWLRLQRDRTTMIVQPSPHKIC